MNKRIFILFFVFFLSESIVIAQINTLYRFPDIPDSIADASERTRYVILHFWDNSPKESMKEPQAMEIFFYAISKGSETVKKTGIERLIDRCVDDTDLYSIVADYIDKFIGTPESQYRDDDLYLYSQQYMVESSLPEEYKIIPHWRIDLLSKNATGTIAPDLKLLDSEGNHISLYEQKMPCIIVFANSECDQCRNEQMQFTPDLRNAKQSGWNIITIYLNGTIPTYAMDSDAVTLPFADIDNSILDNDIYV